MRFSTQQEVRDWADAAVADQLNYPDTDPNPYATHTRRYDWQRALRGNLHALLRVLLIMIWLTKEAQRMQGIWLESNQ